MFVGVRGSPDINNHAYIATKIVRITPTSSKINVFVIKNLIRYFTFFKTTDPMDSVNEFFLFTAPNMFEAFSTNTNLEKQLNNKKYRFFIYFYSKFSFGLYYILKGLVGYP